MMVRLPAVLTALVVLGSLSSPGAAQFHEADPEAMKAFETLIEGYRERPALGVKSSVTITVSQDGVESEGSAAQAEITFTRDRRGTVVLRGFTCYIGGGQLAAVHGETDHSYFSTPDDGAPYYALMNAFVDIPFPHLAIAFGEAGIDDLCMQFHPKAPWVRPTAVGTQTLEGDGGERTVQRITLSSDFSTMEVDVDETTGLIESIDLRIDGGSLVQSGATVRYRHRFEYDTFEDAAPDVAFAAGGRQRVDLLASLVPRQAPVAVGPADGAQLVGAEAPPFILATADGQAVDLEDLRGTVVVLDFWATWCPPCRVALPKLAEVAEWGSTEQLPLSVITVNVWEIRDPQGDTPDARLEAVRAFMQQHRLMLPIGMDYTDEVAAAYGVQGIPTTVIIRADGIVHAVHSGADPEYVERLQREVTEAIEAIEAPEGE